MLRTHVSTAGDQIFWYAKEGFFLLFFFFCLAHGACNNLI